MHLKSNRVNLGQNAIRIYDEPGKAELMTETLNLKLENGGRTFHERIVNALERDIREGVLRNGSRLPAQRAVAAQLGLSTGTIIKAYRELERRGLVRGYVGRGTYVIAPGALIIQHDNHELPIDLSLDVIPHQAAGQRYADHRGKFTRDVDLYEALAYAPPVGTELARRASATWLRRIANFEIPWKRLILTTGSQHAMALTFGVLCRRGDTILCEAETRPALRSLAAHRGYNLYGLRLDGEGVSPSGLEHAIQQTKARVIYIMPTMQVPTGCTMGLERRQAIAKIARRHQLWIVEDDNFALFATRDREQRVPLTTLVPDQSFYIGGVSKSIAPGLRLGFLACPSGPSMEAVTSAIRATVYTSSSLGGLLFCQWIDDGTAFQIAEKVKNEIKRRIEIAQELLGPLLISKKNNAPHLWFEMPLLEAEQTNNRALRAGVVVSPHVSPISQGAALFGIRVCLGATVNDYELTVGLQRLKSALAPELQRLVHSVC